MLKKRIISQFKFLQIVILAACFISLAGCQETALQEFVNRIAPGYKPLKILYIDDQIRPGYTKIEKRDYEFDARIITFADKRLVSDKSNFEINRNQLVKGGAELRNIVGGSLSFANIDKIEVIARGIYSYYLPKAYEGYVGTEEDLKTYQNKSIIKEILLVEKLEFKVFYNKTFSAQADLANISKEVKAGVAISSESENELSILYNRRLLGYRDEKIDPTKVKIEKDDVIVYGKVAIDNQEPVKVKAIFTDGSPFLYADIDVYKRYAIKVRPNNLDSIAAINKNNKELGKKRFNLLNTSLEYNIP